VTANYRDRSISLLVGRGDGTFKSAVTSMRGFEQVTDGFAHEQR
jgi:hypothetical protein